MRFVVSLSSGRYIRTTADAKRGKLGKSFLTSLLPAYLQKEHALKSVSLSLDDLYLPHRQLARLAETNSDNVMWQGRGQPGTHDLVLGLKCLEALSQGESIALPTYDKSRFDGKGDRAEETINVQGAVDIVLFEGWMTGFRALPDTELKSIYERAKQDPKSLKRDYDGEPFLTRHSLENLQQVNGALEAYEDMWRYIDCFIQLKPASMAFVWEWRLQQEHNMMAKNGGKGMTDDQVRQFIERYMPSYELFAGGVHGPDAKWSGKGLQMTLAKSRAVTAIEEF